MSNYFKIICTILLSLILQACNDKQTIPVSLEKSCLDPLSSKRQTYLLNMQAEKFLEAAQEIEECIKVIKKPEIVALLKTAEVNNFKKRGADKTLTFEARLAALDALLKKYPEESKVTSYAIRNVCADIAKNEAAPISARLAALKRLKNSYADDADWATALFVSLEIKNNAENRARELVKTTNEILDRKKEAKTRKAQGVSIGMTQEEVIASSWGKPNSINRTVTASSNSEQWVYPGGYLYFENGLLTTVQN
jgi:hypothetical protein